jgi:hypothetical protein
MQRKDIYTGQAGFGLVMLIINGLGLSRRVVE